MSTAHPPALYLCSTDTWVYHAGPCLAAGPVVIPNPPRTGHDLNTRLGQFARAVCDPAHQPHQWINDPQALIQQILTLTGCPGPEAPAWDSVEVEP